MHMEQVAASEMNSCTLIIILFKSTYTEADQ